MLTVELDKLYKCLCDVQRLRILNLLMLGALCVCHLQEILDESQVKVSKQLQYLKKMGLVSAQREGMWMVYSLNKPFHPLLVANIQASLVLRDEYPFFAEDLIKRELILKRFTENRAECPKVVYQSCENKG